jgi:hypothetical protein
MHRVIHEDGLGRAMDAGIATGVSYCSITDFSFERAAQLIAAGSSGSNPDAPAGLGRLLGSWTATNNIKDIRYVAQGHLPVSGCGSPPATLVLLVS